MASDARPRVGVSACLLGERVRYDGRDKRCARVVDELARRFELVPICPEVEMGLGVPREPVRLERGEGGERHMRGVTSRLDCTAIAEETARRLLGMGGPAHVLEGYVLKSRSPSCGLLDVPRFDEQGGTVGVGAGLFAQCLREHAPSLPLIDEAQLEDAEQRRRFIDAVEAQARRRG